MFKYRIKAVIPLPPPPRSKIALLHFHTMFYIIAPPCKEQCAEADVVFLRNLLGMHAILHKTIAPEDIIDPCRTLVCVHIGCSICSNALKKHIQIPRCLQEVMLYVIVSSKEGIPLVEYIELLNEETTPAMSIFNIIVVQHNSVQPLVLELKKRIDNTRSSHAR